MDNEYAIRKKVALRETVTFRSAAAQNQNAEYTLNEIGFLPTEKKRSVLFTDKEGEGMQRFRMEYLPEQCRELFKIHYPAQPYLYTGFDESGVGKPVEVDLHEFPGIARAYFTMRIREYLSSKSYLTESNYLNDTTFWFKLGNMGDYSSFEKYTIKVVHRFSSKSFSLNITYGGISHILNKSVETVTAGGSFDPELFGRVVFRKKIYKFKYLPEEAKQHLSEVFPVMNTDFEAQLEIHIPPVPNKFKYSSNIRKVEDFYDQYLDNDAFRSVIPIKSSWEKLPASQVSRIGNPGLLFQFGGGNNNTDLLNGLRRNGPYKSIPASSVTIFFIYHEQDRVAMQTLKSNLDGSNDNNTFGSLMRTSFYFDESLDIVFADRTNPFPGTAEAIQAFNLKNNGSYLAIYMSPYGKFNTTEEEHSVYFRIKMHLLRRGIAMQGVEVNKMLLAGSNLRYWIPNIAIASIAKLGGIPWRIGNEIRNELVVGFGLYNSKKYGRKYVGSSVCFKNDGTFTDFNYFPSDEPWEIAASLEKALIKYLKENTQASRLVIHYYKDISSRELKPIEDKLQQFRADIPVVVIRINKTDSNTFLVKDPASSHLVLQSGSYINIFKNEYLLYVNDRFSATTACKSSPMPIRLGIRSTQPEMLKDEGMIRDLMQQLYDFCFIHWRSLTQHKNPVTTSYPRMLAEKASWFDDEILSIEVRRKPFFL
jgi:hypothetical protein